MSQTAIDIITFAVFLVGIVVIPDTARFVCEFKKTIKQDAESDSTVRIDKRLLEKLLKA